MLAGLLRICRSATALLLVTLYLIPSTLFAQDHVVTRSDLQHELLSAARLRRERVDKLQGFFGSDAARNALRKAGMDTQRVQTAVAQMSDQELATLAAKADQAQADFAAGSLTNQELTYIIIALATAVIIILILKA